MQPDAPIQSGNLTWNNIGSILSATNIEATTLSGSGANITALSAANISTGTLSVSRGGTGTGSKISLLSVMVLIHLYNLQVYYGIIPQIHFQLQI